MPSALKDLTPQECARLNWVFILNTLNRTREELEKGGVRHSWLDPAIQIAQQESNPATTSAPIDMVLFCPACGQQHIDAVDDTPTPMVPDGVYCYLHFESETGVRWSDGVERRKTWTNPPHRSHLCHKCGHIWRPADVPTNGVQAIQTRGKVDSPQFPALTPPLDAPKAEMTLIERKAVEVLNHIKALADDDCLELSVETRMQIDVVLMTAAQRRVGVA